MARQKKRAKSRVNIPIILAAVLLCLTLISIHLAGGIVARYTTTTDSGDSARVIRFGDITLTLIDGTEQILYPGATPKWNTKVSFDGSESATYVFVEVTGISSASGATVTLFHDGPSWTVDTEYWTAVDTVNYPGVYYHALAPNATMDEVPLFENDTATTAASAELTAAQLPTITATFRASVVQSNGFNSPEAAWQSLEENHKP